MAKEKSSQLTFAAFQYDVVIVFSDDVVGSRVKRDSILGKYDGEPASGLHSYTKDGSYSYLFLRPNAQPSTIAHESWHCIRRMLLYSGVEMDNELVAYHLGYLVGEIHARQQQVKSTIPKKKRETRRA